MILSTLFRKAAARFRAGDFFQAHELWEELWHKARGKEKETLQGLIQAAVALHHLSKGNLRGARYLYPRALKRLAGREDLKPYREELVSRMKKA